MTPVRPVAVATPQGLARLHVSPPLGRARALFVLGHGAGGGVDAPDLAALASELPLWGLTVVRVEQPWRVSGRRVAPAPKNLDEAWLVCVAEARDRFGRTAPLVIGGRSAGARVACRTAAALDATAVVALAFPLHPPGRLDTTRADELAEASRHCPLLVLQGAVDPFGGPSEFGTVEVHTVPGADHSFQIGRRRAGEVGVTSSEAALLVADAVRRWWDEQAAGRGIKAGESLLRRTWPRPRGRPTPSRSGVRQSEARGRVSHR